MAWNRAGSREEVLDLLQLLDRLVGTGDVGEGDLRLVLVDLLGLGLAELAGTCAAALHRVHEAAGTARQQHHRQQAEQQR